MSSSDASHASLYRELPSRFEELDALVEATQAFMDEATDDEDLAYRVTLLASEAVTNAIKHGNGLDPSKKVVMHLVAHPDRFELTVEDEGGGFDESEVANPLADDHLLESSGRGIFLMRQLADEVSTELDGRRMRLVFRRS